jgi:hypothetical protein
MQFRKLILYFLLFALLYFETEEIAGLKFAVLWKSVLLFVVGFRLVFGSGNRFLPRLVLWGLLFSVQSALNMSLFIDPAANISEFIKNAYIPVFFAAFHPRISSSMSEEKIYGVLTDTAYFVVLSSIPFHFGLLEPRGLGYDLSLFGYTGEGFVGIFQTSHSASITLGFALVILFDNFRVLTTWLKKSVLIIVISIGVASLYLTYARTGYFIFLSAVFVYLILNKSRLRLAWLMVTSSLVFISSLYLFVTSDIFEMRILGINQYMVESGSTDIGIDSGRWGFWVAAISYFIEQDFFSQLIGLGSALSMDLMYQTVGLRIYAHNGFINIFQFNGYLGFGLYCLFLVFLIKNVLKYSYNQYYPLIVSLLVCYLAQMFVQGERIFLADLLLVGGLLLGSSSPVINQRGINHFVAASVGTR